MDQEKTRQHDAILPESLKSMCQLVLNYYTKFVDTSNQDYEKTKCEIQKYKDYLSNIKSEDYQKQFEEEEFWNVDEILTEIGQKVNLMNKITQTQGKIQDRIFDLKELLNGEKELKCSCIDGLCKFPLLIEYLCKEFQQGHYDFY